MEAAYHVATISYVTPQPNPLLLSADCSFTQSGNRYQLFLPFLLVTCWLVESDYCLSKIAAFCLLAGAPLAKAKVLGLIKSSKTGLSRAKICPVGSDLFWSSNFRALFERTTQ